MKILEDQTIYCDEAWYSTFPSVVSRPDGELIVAFRRAPERRGKQHATCISHVDPNSYLYLVRSRDLGRTWSQPELIYAHPMGGSQDPCMVQLADGTLICASYLWTLVPDAGAEHLTRNLKAYGCWSSAALGGYLLRSGDAGASWEGPILPPQFEDEQIWLAGYPRPALNRGAMCQGKDGSIYWAVVRTPRELGHTVLELLVSDDQGSTWEHRSHMASDDKVVFNETSLIETASGDLVAFVRTANYDDHGVIIRSTDHGASWEPWQDLGIIGHPYHAIQLPCGHIFIVYGYRHPPYGIRARIMDPECREFVGDELVLRDDGGNSDIGYPWACVTADERILVTYYLNHADGTRFIAGTYLGME
jgi:hypothetical protein